MLGKAIIEQKPTSCIITTPGTTRHPSHSLQATRRPPARPSAIEHLQDGLGHDYVVEQRAGPVGFGLVGGGLPRCAEVREKSASPAPPRCAPAQQQTIVALNTSFSALISIIAKLSVQYPFAGLLLVVPHGDISIYLHCSALYDV